MWWQEFVGMPFVEKGRGPDSFDCWGLVVYIYQKHKGIILPSHLDDYRNTLDRTVSPIVIEESKTQWQEIKEPDSMDVVLLRQGGVPMHIGLVTKPGHMIHCEYGVGVIHEKYDSMRWKSRIDGFFKHI